MLPCKKLFYEDSFSPRGEKKMKKENKSQKNEKKKNEVPTEKELQRCVIPSNDHVITGHQFYVRRIVCRLEDKTLKVWSSTTGKWLRTLLGHTGGVWSPQLCGRWEHSQGT